MEKEKLKFFALVFSVVFNVVFFVIMIVSITPILMSVMIFDAPGSEKNPITILFFYSLATFPVNVIISIISSRIIYLFKRYVSTIILSLTPVLNFIWFGIMFLLLIFVNNGNFT